MLEKVTLITALEEPSLEELKMKKDNILKKMISLLKIEPKKRKKVELNYIANALKSIEVFQNKNSLEFNDFYEIAQTISYQNHKKGYIVFEIDEIADSIYIILKGSVNVFYPNKLTNRKFDITSLSAISTVMNAGESFGELGIIKNKRRAATIECREECDFAVVDKETYQKAFQNIQEKLYNSKLSLIMSMPLFNNWLKSSLFRIVYYFSSIKYTKGQIIYNANSILDKVYIVSKGEFEGYITKEEEIKNNFVTEVSKNSYQTILASMIYNRNIQKKKITMIPITLFCSGQIFGDVDICYYNKTILNIKCKSLEGELLYIDKENFINKIFSNRFSKEIILWNYQRLNELIDEQINNSIKSKNYEKKLEERKNKHQVNNVSTKGNFKGFPLIKMSLKKCCRTPQGLLEFQKEQSRFKIWEKKLKFITKRERLKAVDIIQLFKSKESKNIHKQLTTSQINSKGEWVSPKKCKTNCDLYDKESRTISYKETTTRNKKLNFLSHIFNET